MFETKQNNFFLLNKVPDYIFSSLMLMGTEKSGGIGGIIIFEQDMS